jgi:uncharacterized protein (DUF885 family)
MLRLSLFLSLLFSSFASGQSIGDFFKQAFEERLRDNPESATNIGRHDYDNRWTDWSKTGRSQRRMHVEERLKQLSAFPAASLSSQDRLTVRLLEYYWRRTLEAEDLQLHLLLVGQQSGFHNGVFSLIDLMPARTVRDYENILARLNAVPALVDQRIGIMDESLDRGLTQPRVVVDLVAAQLAAQIQQDRDSTRLLSAFRRFPPNIPQAEQSALKTQAVEAYEKQFLPAWRKLRDYLTGKYAPKARPAIGLGSLPGGREAYATLIRTFTTTMMTADEIHKLGLEEVKRIEAEMQAVMKEAGFTGTVEEFDRRIASLPEQHFRDKDEMLAYCRNIAKIIEPELPNQFRTIPILLYGIRAIPPDREAATASSAQPPSPDYTTPGWFNLNTYQPERQLKYDMESLVLHEAVPGHIFQSTLARALQDLPEIRRFSGNTAYAEGWALYTESLGSQLGVYRDPYSRFGQLSSERFRAVRLVVDTGIHALGWTRDQAIAYFRQHAPSESLAEVDRYISLPSQALAYKIGQLKIRQLRTLAEQRLGPKFDIREFHDVVLRNGPLPLEMLDQQVQEYLQTASSR